jgi:hypothetical protein
MLSSHSEAKLCFFQKKKKFPLFWDFFSNFYSDITVVPWGNAHPQGTAQPSYFWQKLDMEVPHLVTKSG